MGVFSEALVIMRPFFLASPLPFLSAFLGSSIDPQVVFLPLSSAGTTFLFVDFNSGVGLWRDLYLCSSQKTVIEWIIPALFRRLGQQKKVCCWVQIPLGTCFFFLFFIYGIKCGSLRFGSFWDEKINGQLVNNSFSLFVQTLSPGLFFIELYNCHVFPKKDRKWVCNRSFPTKGDVFSSMRPSSSLFLFLFNPFSGASYSTSWPA